MGAILRIANSRGIIIIEDCAHALGAEYNGKKVGVIGDAAIFSFGQGKNMPCFGGGMITTNSSRLFNLLQPRIYRSGFPPPEQIMANIMKLSTMYLLTATPLFSAVTFPVIRLLSIFHRDIMDFQKKETISSTLVGNFEKCPLRLTNVQALVGVKQMEHLGEFNVKRMDNSLLLIRSLEGLDSIQIPEFRPGGTSIYLYFKIQVGNKELFQKALLKRRIDVSIKDEMSNCSMLDNFKQFRTDCPVAANLSGRMVEIPNNHFLGKEDILYIAASIKEVQNNLKTQH
jgi:dTDP-4-amino-4,6-dideoxygalactose transaminase